MAMKEIQKQWAAIGLGANLPSWAGGPAETVRAAAAELAEFGEEFRLSSLYRTRPVGYDDQPEFINAAAVLRTELAPEDLLRKLMALELHYGRDREHCPPNGPRTLDLDLLLVEGVVLSSWRLVLPHPRMHLRRFVLQPLAEIAPDLLHPVLGVGMAELLDRLPAEDGDVVRIA
jgi:2-amino-4-hydroxy-6-hydroxymethyldihydropteridine diphosphokinase